MDPYYLLHILSLFLYGIVISRVFLFVVSPLYQISGAVKDNFFDYLGEFLFSVIFRMVLVVLLMALSSYLVLMGFAIDYTLFSLFDLDLKLSSAHWYIYLLYLLVAYVNLRTFLRERSMVKHGIYEKVESHVVKKLGKSFPRNYGDSLEKNLNGIRFYAMTTSNITAYTYGGFFYPPRVVISNQLLTESWAPCLRSVLLHEINHIEREDCFFLVLKESIQSVLYIFLNALNRSNKICSVIPILNILIKILCLGINKVWNFYQGLFLIVGRKDEFFADTETFSKNGGEHLILALNNIKNNFLLHMGFRKLESDAREIATRDVFLANFQPANLKTLLRELILPSSNSDTHPEIEERYYWAAKMSSRLVSKKIPDSMSNYKKRYTEYTIWGLLILPILFLLYNEISFYLVYEFSQEDVIEYMKALKGDK